MPVAAANVAVAAVSAGAPRRLVNLAPPHENNAHPSVIDDGREHDSAAWPSLRHQRQPSMFSTTSLLSVANDAASSTSSNLPAAGSAAGYDINSGAISGRTHPSSAIEPISSASSSPAACVSCSTRGDSTDAASEYYLPCRLTAGSDLCGPPSVAVQQAPTVLSAMTNAVTARSCFTAQSSRSLSDLSRGSPPARLQHGANTRPSNAAPASHARPPSSCVISIYNSPFGVEDPGAAPHAAAALGPDFRIAVRGGPEQGTAELFISPGAASPRWAPAGGSDAVHRARSSDSLLSPVPLAALRSSSAATDELPHRLLSVEAPSFKLRHSSRALSSPPTAGRSARGRPVAAALEGSSTPAQHAVEATVTLQVRSRATSASPLKDDCAALWSQRPTPMLRCAALPSQSAPGSDLQTRTQDARDAVERMLEQLESALPPWSAVDAPPAGASPQRDALVAQRRRSVRAAWAANRLEIGDRLLQIATAGSDVSPPSHPAAGLVLLPHSVVLAGGSPPSSPPPGGRHAADARGPAAGGLFGELSRGPGAFTRRTSTAAEGVVLAPAGLPFVVPLVPCGGCAHADSSCGGGANVAASADLICEVGAEVEPSGSLLRPQHPSGARPSASTLADSTAQPNKAKATLASKFAAIFKARPRLGRENTPPWGAAPLAREASAAPRPPLQDVGDLNSAEAPDYTLRHLLQPGSSHHSRSGGGPHRSAAAVPSQFSFGLRGRAGPPSVSTSGTEATDASASSGEIGPALSLAAPSTAAVPRDLRPRPESESQASQTSRSLYWERRRAAEQLSDRRRAAAWQRAWWAAEQGAFLPVAHKGEGVYHVTARLPRPGFYRLAATVAGRAVANSPQLVLALPPAALPSQLLQPYDPARHVLTSPRLLGANQAQQARPGSETVRAGSLPLPNSADWLAWCSRCYDAGRAAYVARHPHVGALEIALVVDATSSMRDDVSQLAAAVDAIFAAASALPFARSVRIAAITYTDHFPQGSAEETVRVCGLTADPAAVRRFLEETRLDSGGDYPEAAEAALHAAGARLDWSEHSARVALWVADAPPHAYEGLDGEELAERRRRFEAVKRRVVQAASALEQAAPSSRAYLSDALEAALEDADSLAEHHDAFAGGAPGGVAWHDAAGGLASLGVRVLAVPLREALRHAPSRDCFHAIASATAGAVLAFDSAAQACAHLPALVAAALQCRMSQQVLLEETVDALLACSGELAGLPPLQVAPALSRLLSEMGATTQALVAPAQRTVPAARQAPSAHTDVCASAAELRGCPPPTAERPPSHQLQLALEAPHTEVVLQLLAELHSKARCAHLAHVSRRRSAAGLEGTRELLGRPETESPLGPAVAVTERDGRSRAGEHARKFDGASSEGALDLRYVLASSLVAVWERPSELSLAEASTLM